MRVITPRFLTEGDEVVVPTIVHNYQPDDADGVACRLKRRASTRWSARTRATSGALASGAERRDDWRFAATASGLGDGHGDGEDRERRRCGRTADPDRCRSALRREVGKSGSVVGAGEATADVDMPAASNPAARIDLACRWRRRWPDRCSARSTS